MHDESVPMAHYCNKEVIDPLPSVAWPPLCQKFKKSESNITLTNNILLSK